MDNQPRSERIRQRSAERRALDRSEVRAMILEAATRLFLAHGYESFSLRQVAEEIGYTPTTIYLYFTDKDALLFAVAVEGFKRFHQALEAAYAGNEHPVTRLAALGNAYCDFGLQNPLHYRLMFMQRPEFLERSLPEDNKPMRESFEVLHRTMQECVAGGFVRQDDPRLLADLVWSLMHGVVSLAIAAPNTTTTEIDLLRAAAIRLVGEGLQIRPGAK